MSALYDDDDVLSGSLSVQSAHRMNASNISSPPPPPPPGMYRSTTPNSINTSRSEPKSGDSSDGGTPGKRPFLRKGSRVEPSALTRIKRDGASPITAPISNTESPDGFNSGLKMSALKRNPGHNIDGTTGSGGFQFDPLPETVPTRPVVRNIRSTANTTESMHRSPPSANMSASIHATRPQNTGPIKSDASENVPYDPELSGTFDRDWDLLKQRRELTHRERQRDLSEFELLEQQLGGVQDMHELSGSSKVESERHRFGDSDRQDALSSMGSERNTAFYANKSPTMATQAHIRTQAQGASGRTQPTHSGVRSSRDGAYGHLEGDWATERENVAALNASYADDFEPEEHDDRNRNSQGAVSAPRPGTGTSAARPINVEAVLQQVQSGTYISRHDASKLEDWEENRNRPHSTLPPRAHTAESTSWGAVTRPQSSSGDRGRMRGPNGESFISDDGGRVRDRSHSPSNFMQPVAGIARSDPNRRSEQGSGADGDSPSGVASRPTSAGGKTLVRSASPGTRGKGVHSEGKAMSSLLDHTYSGSVVNRPPARPRSASGQRRSPSPAAAGSSGVRGSRGSMTPEVSPTPSLEQQHAIAAKAAALEEELAAYKTENAQIRALRKQQEVALAEAIQKKEEALQWAAAHKASVEAECEEMQKKAKMQEKRLAAKLAQEQRNARLDGSATSTRKEKQEREALESQIEQLRAEADSAAKKTKLTEQRLYSLVREKEKSIESLQAALQQRQTSANALLAYLERQGVRVPATLRANALGAGYTSGSSGSKAPLSFASRDRTHAHKVAQESPSWESDEHAQQQYDEEHEQGSISEQEEYGGREYSSAQRSKNFAATDSAEEADVDIELKEARDAPKGALAEALFRTRDGPGSKKDHGRTAASARVPNEAVRQTASTTPPYDPSRYSGTLVSRANPLHSVSPAVSHELEAEIAQTHTRENRPNHGSQHEEGDSGLGSYRGPSDSWQRSSRSSKGSRYSEEDEEEASGHAEEDDRVDATAAAMRSRSQHGRPVPAAQTKAQVTDQGYTDPNENKAPGRSEEVLPDGRRVVRYRNGTVKEVQVNGESLVRFLNGDTKWTSADSAKVVYFYSEAKTRHTTYSNGLEVYEFPNGQVERHHPDGTKEIAFPDRTRKLVLANGLQETHFPDGVKVCDYPDGRREVIEA